MDSLLILLFWLFTGGCSVLFLYVRIMDYFEDRFLEEKEEKEEEEYDNWSYDFDSD